MALRQGSRRKSAIVMVRLDPAQKALVEAAAFREDLSTSTWIRTQILKLARGWKLVPPGTRVIPPNDETYGR